MALAVAEKRQRLQQQQNEEAKDKEELRRLQDRQNEDGAAKLLLEGNDADKKRDEGGAGSSRITFAGSADEGGATSSGTTVAGSAVDGGAKFLQLGKLEVPWDELTSWHGPLVGLDNNFLEPFEDLEGGDYRNWAYVGDPRKWE